MSDLMQTSFAGGEWSPRLDGRVDIERYRRACKKLRNFIIWPHGAAEFRPGFRYIAGTKTNASASRLVPFEFGTTQAYILEFGATYIRFYKSQAQITSGGSAYEISSPWAAADLFDLKFVQSADVLYITHADYAPRKLTRTGDTAWTLTQIAFDPPPTAVIASAPAANLTLGATSGTSVLVTASSAVFLSGDVNRYITSGAGRATIIGYISTTQVIVEVIDAFSGTSISSGSWSLAGTPYGSLAPGAASPVRAITTLLSDSENIEIWTLGNTNGNTDWTESGAKAGEYYRAVSPTTKPAKVYINGLEATEGTVGSLNAGEWDFGDNDAIGGDRLYVRLSDASDPDAGVSGLVCYQANGAPTEKPKTFRSADVGKYVYINSGLIKITRYDSGVQVSGEILKELSGVTASLAWTLESDAWSAALGYPRSATFHQDRLVFAGSDSYPQTFWGSATGDYENFARGTGDADSFSHTLNARQVNTIFWMVSKGALIIGTAGAEWKVGDKDTLLTPSIVNADIQTNYGSEGPAPVMVSHALLFLEQHGRKLREFSFDLDADGFVASDRTILAEHVTSGGIVEMAYQQNPIPTVWCVLAGGNLVAFTYIAEEQVYAWHVHTSGGDGSVESVAVIPGTGYDEVWAIVNRTINGSTVRYVEMLEPLFDSTDHTLAKFLDSGVAYSGAATTTITGLTHLEGETVGVVANGAVHADKTVASGQITLDYEATTAYVGLKYTGTLTTLRLMPDVKHQGVVKRISRVILRFYRTLLAKVGPNETDLYDMPFRDANDPMDAPPPIFTGDKLCDDFPADNDTDAYVTVVQDRPMPMTLLAIMADGEAGD